MILFFYNLTLLAVLIIGSPWWLWRMATVRKYRAGLRERLGNVPERLQHQERPVLWLHAVSVGEVLAVSRLVAELDKALPGHRLLISTTTATGQALARERFGADRVFYCPLDLPWAVHRYMQALQPRMLMLAETEFWPNMLSACFRRGIPVAVVNARVSDRSYPRYLRLRSLWRPFLERLSRVLAQTETDAARLKAIGCRPDRVSVAGNLKFDVRFPAEAEATRLLKGLVPNLRLIVAGSTLDGEEKALLQAWTKLLAVERNLLFVLAPRHPERFPAVEALLKASGFSWVKLVRAGQIVLLDSIGELASIYSLASVAFVGGSLVPAGGHNPLEPAQFGVPVVMGPHYANFRAMTEDLLAHEAIRIAQKTDLAQALIELLQDRRSADWMGAQARQVFEAQSGATARCVDALRVLLTRTEERTR
jgi:3-deoxy-D-manno-octulosonic-acid transferase